MRSHIVLVMVLIMACSVGMWSQILPTEFNPNLLSHSRGLPNNFLLFSPDTSVQILFNPARAALTGQRFVYANYLPSKDQTVSIASLFNAMGTTWLLEVSNTLQRQTDDYSSNSQSLQKYIYPSSFENTINNDQFSGSYLYHYSKTAMKLSLIGGTSGDSYSLGIYGILYPYERSIHMNLDDSRIYQSMPYSNRDIFRLNQRLDEKNSMYVAGVEYSISGSNSDLIAGIQIQKNRILISQSGDFTEEYSYYYSSTDNYISTSIGNFSSSAKTNEPIIYKAYGYYHHTADVITSTDHYFISSNVYTSSGKIFMDNTETDKSFSRYYSNPPSLQSSSQILFHQEDTHDWGVKVATGYLVSRKLDDIEFLVGLQPQFGYDENKYTSGSTALINDHMWSAAVQLPIYLDFTPVNWCSFFGGLNYQYTYSHVRRDITFPLLQHSYNYSTNSSISTSSGTAQDTYSVYSSSSNVYAGVELKHSSGLRLQCAFNGSLSSYSNWNISVGYVF